MSASHSVIIFSTTPHPWPHIMYRDATTFANTPFSKHLHPSRAGFGDNYDCRQTLDYVMNRILITNWDYMAILEGFLTSVEATWQPNYIFPSALTKNETSNMNCRKLVWLPRFLKMFRCSIATIFVAQMLQQLLNICIADPHTAQPLCTYSRTPNYCVVIYHCLNFRRSKKAP